MTALPPKPTHGFYPLRFCSFRVSSADDRRRMVAEAAYYRALERDFVGGHAHEDWLAAEAEVDQFLAREYLQI